MRVSNREIEALYSYIVKYGAKANLTDGYVPGFESMTFPNWLSSFCVVYDRKLKVNLFAYVNQFDEKIIAANMNNAFFVLSQNQEDDNYIDVAPQFKSIFERAKKYQNSMKVIKQ